MEKEVTEHDLIVFMIGMDVKLRPPLFGGKVWYASKEICREVVMGYGVIPMLAVRNLYKKFIKEIEKGESCSNRARRIERRLWEREKEIADDNSR